MSTLELRRYASADFSCLAELLRDQLTQDLLLAHPSSQNRDDSGIKVWIERRDADLRSEFRIIYYDGGPIGFVQLTDIHGIDRYGKIGICLSHARRGQGLGRMALEVTLALAQEELELRKVIAEIRTDNERSLKLFKLSNFNFVGILRSHYCEFDQCFDVAIFERVFGRLK